MSHLMNRTGELGQEIQTTNKQTNNSLLKVLHVVPEVIQKQEQQYNSVMLMVFSKRRQDL